MHNMQHTVVMDINMDATQVRMCTNFKLAKLSPKCNYKEKTKKLLRLSHFNDVTL